MKIFREKRPGRVPHGGKQSAGFYVAMAVCLLAIGAAAWTTVSSLRGLSADLTKSAESAPESTTSIVRAEVNVSGVPATSRTASRPVSSQASSRPASSAASRAASSAVASASSVSAASAVEANRPVTPSSAAASSVSSAAQKPFQVTDTTFILPVAGGVLKEYGPSEYSMTFGDWRAHNGVDLKASKGSNVASIGDGTVKSFEQDDMLGNVLVVAYDGGIEVSYCGLSDTPTVKPGDAVRCGQTLGIIDDIPCETVEECHLHMEVRVNGKLTEPLTAIGKADKLPSEGD